MLGVSKLGGLDTTIRRVAHPFSDSNWDKSDVARMREETAGMVTKLTGIRCSLLAIVGRSQPALTPRSRGPAILLPDLADAIHGCATIPHAGWVYEEKADGWRMMAWKDGHNVRLVSPHRRAGEDDDPA